MRMMYVNAIGSPNRTDSGPFVLAGAMVDRAASRILLDKIEKIMSECGVEDFAPDDLWAGTGVWAAVDPEKRQSALARLLVLPGLAQGACFLGGAVVSCKTDLVQYERADRRALMQLWASFLRSLPKDPPPDDDADAALLSFANNGAGRRMDVYAREAASAVSAAFSGWRLGVGPIVWDSLERSPKDHLKVRVGDYARFVAHALWRKFALKDATPHHLCAPFFEDKARDLCFFFHDAFDEACDCLSCKRYFAPRPDRPSACALRSPPPAFSPRET